MAAIFTNLLKEIDVCVFRVEKIIPTAKHDDNGAAKNMANKCTALPALGHLCGVFWWGDCSINAVGIEKNGKVCPSIAIIKKNMYLC